MERRNEYYDYWLGTQITPLRHLKDGEKLWDSIRLTFPAKRALDNLLSLDLVRTGFDLCVEQAIALKNVIETLIPKGSEENRELGILEVVRVREAVNAFETALSIQFNQVNTYRVTSKGTHDVRKLIESPGDTFGGYWLGISENAQNDWTSGAKCLAFELPTACGFHVVRSMEAVVLKYLGLLNVIPEKRDLGHYVDLMKENGVSEKATDIVNQIRKHHRNPLMHPEDVLDVPTAMSLYDLCRAAIVSLVSDMTDRQLIFLSDGEQAELQLEEGEEPVVSES